jgi:hypothetical protein
MTNLDIFEARLAEAIRNRDEFMRYAQGIINQMVAHIETLQEIVTVLKPEEESGPFAGSIPLDEGSSNGVPVVSDYIPQDGD